MKLQEHVVYEERLEELEMFTLEKNMFKEDLMKVNKYLKRGCKEDGARLFSVMPRDKARDNGHKLK